VRGGEAPARLKVLAGPPDEAPVEIGEFKIEADSSGHWRTLTTAVKPVSGRTELLFKFVSDSTDRPLCDLLSFRFEQKK